MRFLAWLPVRAVCRLRVSRIENLPDEGPALIACYHVSFVDAVVIMAACGRPI